ncbi:MAG: nicotinate (nicotinamide) nucleotide adenylyltransferase [Nitrospinaceae bacterium]|nr:nicotinate (nicotinamide) nucleotide adenylyltransferase [Nitrospinaceae bacterium]NIR55708.1 nicotinate (nicotinamide) nucleotide adenylyltransferase [Nitrospinaceae bacterium]NIS86152.1 nicotinate (nicotinamide) nucleotide adenylyltransferase [Nitrospinaceae bacterium]NIT82996.1 nicotinate (nicotinamide) nucleotide adenylyltransferase [Nitrospinaceae bacterium]NIU45200.1 nicotinate (nicotinamide) nucleotide adenylyltransferase [Nitrospinaceae bacterium]
MMGKEPKKKIGLLGGTFDPVHEGHLGMARDLVRIVGLDRVIFIPACQSPHKQNQSSADPAHRLNMLKIALTGRPEFQISEIELERGDISYTCDTLSHFRKQFPGDDLYLIMGADTFKDFSTWKQYQTLLREAHLLVATRPGHIHNLSRQILRPLLDPLSLTYELQKETPGLQVYLCRETGKTLTFCEIQPRDISSREIREKLRGGNTAKNMLPPDVEEYIITHRLYPVNPQP